MYAEYYFQSMKPRIYTADTLKCFDFLEGIVLDNEDTFKRLVKREMDERIRIQQVQELYLKVKSKPTS